MSTRDIVQDIVKHTAGLGFITSVKVSSTDEATTLDAMDADRTVILQAKLHNVVDEFTGEFGLGNLGFLAGVSALPNYQTEDSTVEVITRDRNGVTSPDHLMFRDAEGNTDQYRFMSKEIIEQTLQTVKFKGVEWDVTLEPTKTKDVLANKYLFTFDIDGQISTIEVHNTLTFNAGVSSMFGSSYSKTLTKNKVVGDEFYTKISALYPNLKVKS